jgi:hypothetical protein
VFRQSLQDLSVGYPADSNLFLSLMFRPCGGEQGNAFLREIEGREASLLLSLRTTLRIQTLTKPASLNTFWNDKLPLREGFTRESRHAGVSMCIGALPGMSI